jgi:BT1 family protein
MLRYRSTAFRLAHLCVLVPYFCYGANAVSRVAIVFFEKKTLVLTPAQSAEILFWLGLPWMMKMMVGVASDAWPIFGSRRAAYLCIGCGSTFVGYLALATSVDTTGGYLLGMLLVTTGFMIQDVVADALSVEVARDDHELAQLQAWGRIAVLAGGISVSYAGGLLAHRLGVRTTFMIAAVLPLLAAVSTLFIPRRTTPPVAAPVAPGSRRNHVILLGGLGYAVLGVLLRVSDIPFAEEIILVISTVVLVLLMRALGLSREVLVAALVIFVFRCIPEVGQGYSFWAIDKLGFDERFLGLLAQITAVLSVVGLIVFRKPIAEKPVSVTMFWVTIGLVVLYLPTIGLFYGVNEWLGLSPRVFAIIDTTIAAPLAQLAMVPMLILIARSARPGAEATTFAVMASMMNLALSASQLFTRYLNDFYAVTQANYSNLGRLMITVSALGLVPLLLLPLLRRAERQGLTTPPSVPAAEAAASTV